MRKYIRHPSDIPIEVELERDEGHKENLRDVSLGGLSFRSHTKLDVGSVINIQITFVDPVFKSQGRVVWSKKMGSFYEIGIEIQNNEQAYRTRMVEQICHIEQYKREVFKIQGRNLTGEQAAMEWIGRYAGDFPRIDEA